MDKTILEIPTELLQAANMTAEEARTQLAIRLYQLHKLNGQQAEILAGESKAIEELAWTNDQTGQFDMDEFLSWASHDLKTPLNAVIGFTRVIMKGMDGPINDIQTTDLTTVYNGGQRMLALVGNLVDMARLNNGEIVLTLEEFESVSLINNVADQWRLQNPAKELIRSINITHPTFKVDAGRFQQLVFSMLNLTAIRITEGSVNLTIDADNSFLNFSIQSAGEKSRDKFEMDSAMHKFIGASLIKLHGGKTNSIEETENGMLVNFSLPY